MEPAVGIAVAVFIGSLRVDSVVTVGVAEAAVEAVGAAWAAAVDLTAAAPMVAGKSYFFIAQAFYLDAAFPSRL